MAFKATKAQQTAIDAKGNILVSAAAGSGKTAVLVERIITKLCSKTSGVSADKLLIVTFTNAAAAEMRSRIEKRLDEEYRKNPQDEGILLQKHLLSSAKICTIDSFCIDLVRENFELAGVSPDFTVSDGNSLRSTDEAVLSEIIDRYLAEKNEDFFELLDIIGSEYNEKNFLEFVLSLYYYSRQLPAPKDWFKSLSSFYSNGSFSKDNLWYKYAFDTAISSLDDYISTLANAVDLLTVSKTASDKYIPEFIELSNILNFLKDEALSSDWDRFYNALSNFNLPKLPIVRGVSDISEVASAKDAYKYIGSKGIERLKKIFYADFEFINSQFLKLYKPLALLSDLLIEFEQELFDAYKAQNVFTFHNTEHLALNILCEIDGDKIKIKEQAEPILERFCEVCVDEYQDTNDLQDILFYVLSNKEEKLFVVGDVKQSIYGFRGANPNNFLAKKNRYKLYSVAEGNDPKKIILGNNFRCKPEVCDFINYFFKIFMTEQTGNILYNEEEQLIPSAVFPKSEACPTCFDLIDTSDCNENSTIIEAKHIAKYIKQTLNSGPNIKQDENTLRNAKYSDFTILLRSAKLKAPIIAEELKRQGIPVNFYVEDFTESIEISIALSLLTVIDNPQNDIELLTILLSPLFCFSVEDLAKIRIDKRDGSLYSALISAYNSGNTEIKKFFDRLENYRRIAVTNSLPSFINYLINESGLLDYVCVLNDGERRRNNLLLLCEYASQFSADNLGSIGDFVKFIKRQAERGLKAAAGASGGDSVSIMSIHASKGLQFPICIVANLNGEFNDNESHENTLYSTDFGIGFKYFDENDKQRYTTVGREAILDKIRFERLQEELRLFYVALTRTQDRLVLVASHSNPTKKAEQLKSILLLNNNEVSHSVFSRTKSYCDWLILALLLHPEGKNLRGENSGIILKETSSNISFNLINGADFDKDNIEYSEEIFEADESLASQMIDNFSYVYPYNDIVGIESKASVSRLVNSAESAKYAFSANPSFMSNGGINSAERGTAMHKVMEFIDFNNTDDLDAELERLYEWQFISETEYNSINRKAISEFFESEIFSRIKSAEFVKREMRFLTEIPARTVENSLDLSFDNEKIIIQGAVDLCFAELDGIVILDFKTDRVSEEAELISAYSEQLKYYAKACEKIFEKPIKQMYIYSFSLSRLIEI